MPTVRPAPDDAFWTALATARWRRVRWRQGGAGPPGDARCTAFDLPLHRAGTYYRRPAYTDGTRWLSQQAYDEMVRRTAGHRASRTVRPGGTRGDGTRGDGTRGDGTPGDGTRDDGTPP